jgi:hypothetical protein
MTTLRFSRIVMISVLTAAGCAANNSDGSGTGGHAGGTTGTGNSAGTSGGHGGTGIAGSTGQTAGTTGTGGTTGVAGAGGQPGGNGGHAAGTSGQSAGAGGHAGGTTGQAGTTGAGGTTGQAGTTGAGGTTTTAGTCTDDKMNGTETGVDCGGSCPACPNYKINAPMTGDTVGSGCAGGPAYMCTRSMAFSPEFKSAEADDFTGTSANPAFVYAVVGHDARSSDGLDSGAAGNGCCQCYQLVFTTPKDQVTGVPTPKPMIVQAFNTGVDGSGMDFDIYMGDGGEGSNTAGCSGGSGKMYSAYPSIGQTNNGGIRAQTVSQCSGTSGLSDASIAATACQSTIATDCEMITSSTASIQSTTQTSCIETNQPQNLYHINWNVMAKRIECPTNLTRVTGCQLTGQGLPQADPTAVDSASASGKGFSSGYTTTTMQDCCRPTCAYKPNVSGAASPYNLFYTCDASGNPS